MLTPGSLTPPLVPVPPRRWTRARTTRWAAALLVATAIVGLVVWVAGLAPTGHERFTASESNRRVTLDAGSYVIFEEYDGASEGLGPPRLSVSGFAVGSSEAEMRIEALDEPATSPEVPTYRWWRYDGRAVARVWIDQDGDYIVRVRPISDSRSNGMDTVTVAVARSAGATWWGSPTGALVLVAAPLLIGGGLLLVSRPGASRSRSGSVGDHG
ncbi:MAG: hypothetical protein JJU45_10725 [Acidimicrobiia bacterium]|nr:hypothetical protein [Acidimicrobiia bacterium]